MRKAILILLIVGGILYVSTTAKEIRAAATWGDEGALRQVQTGQADPTAAGGCDVLSESSVLQSGTSPERGGIPTAAKAADKASSVSRGGCERSADPVHVQPTVFKVTAYSPNEESTGKGPGHLDYKKTATGTTASEGRTIAADFRVLPPGSVVHIEGYGERIVEDCGGAVNGQHIDLYFEDTQEADDFGKQYLKVTVLRKGGD